MLTKLCYRAMKYSHDITSHFSHPQHKLKFEYTDIPFGCDGCKEVGIGSKYKCSTCDYHLHMHCAVPCPSIIHPFYSKCCFYFMERPPGHVERYCNACMKNVSGFMYHCSSCGFDLHPCCAKLPIMLDDGQVKLDLYCKVSSVCRKCGRKGKSWSYRSTCKKYTLHVGCVKEMLVESWYFEGKININKNNESRNDNFRKLETSIPSLKGTLPNRCHKENKGKVKKCCEMGGLCLQFVVSAAVLGDPTAPVAGVVGSSLSK